MIFRVILLAVLTGCGIKVESDDIIVKHQIDLSQIEKYFEEYCREIYPLASQEQIENCVTDNVVDFIASVGQ